MVTPADSYSKAIAAYREAARAHAGEVRAPQTDTGDSFSTLVKSAIAEVAATGQRSEELAAAALVDKADISQVVTAVAEAEATLQTMTAVRDRVLEAYKEIIRMPI